MSMSSTIVGPRRVKVWQADAEWPDDVYVVPAEDLDIVQVDRDIKAANLQLLVDKALVCGAAIEAFEWNENIALEDTLQDAAQAAWAVVAELARSLKQ